ncbi:EF-hand domain-containing protein [Pseudorhodobacter sp.]|uniref:EF-hand domain-containing protein n=1 Tax=Pseudorhodobacter sp. TaxID=1934400 RepID=UPI002AFF4467|nr:EF-hand domain-containing protein [Pseudorhodobacter sp.]
MKVFALALGAFLAVMMAPISAQVLIADTDGDGVYSMQELRAAFPALTERDFIAADSNADGAVDIEELAAAVEAGYIRA